MFLQLSFVA